MKQGENVSPPQHTETMKFSRDNSRGPLQPPPIPIFSSFGKPPPLLYRPEAPTVSPPSTPPQGLRKSAAMSLKSRQGGETWTSAQTNMQKPLPRITFLGDQRLYNREENKGTVHAYNFTYIDIVCYLMYLCH